MQRPYPWKCATCRQKAVGPSTVDYQTEIEHDGRAYTVSVPQLEILECAHCGARMLPDEAHARLDAALRAKAELLSSSEIRAKRKNLGLSQEELASYLRVAKETVSRWETGGQIQQRAMDQLLRLFFDVPEVRRHLGMSASVARAAGETAMAPSGTV